MELYRRCSKSPIADSQDAIWPFMGHRIELAVQLAHGDRLWVDNSDLNLILIHQILHSKHFYYFYYFIYYVLKNNLSISHNSYINFCNITFYNITKSIK